MPLAPEDQAFFIYQVCQIPGKPVNFVPVIDENIRKWYKGDSLHTCNDSRFSADQVFQTPGPRAVGGISKINEPVADLFQRFHQALVKNTEAKEQNVENPNTHSEYIMEENKEIILGDSNDVSLHNEWRSPESCLSATTRLVNIAKKYGRRVHILHITTSEEMDFLRDNKDIASVELLANHLTLHAPDCYERLGTHAQQNPPIRELHHQEALWKALNDGTVDILASDHAPHTLEEKALAYPKSPSGTPGVQTLVPIMLNHVNEGKLSLEKLVELWSSGPERIHKLVGKGRIANGYDADFTIVDLNKKKTIKNAQQKSKAKWTPYDGMKVTGWPIATIIRGNIVMIEDELSSSPIGKPVLFQETITN